MYPNTTAPLVVGYMYDRTLVQETTRSTYEEAGNEE